jgi:hypothetical protein
MTLLNPVELSPEAAAQFGTVVNNEPTLSAEQAEWESKAEALDKPFNVKVSLTASQKSRLQRIAVDSGLSVDELVNQTLTKLVETSIGAPVISAPSWAKGKTRVTGYSGSVSRG